MPETSRDNIVVSTQRVHLPSPAPPREASLPRMSWLETGRKEERGAEEGKGNEECTWASLPPAVSEGGWKARFIFLLCSPVPSPSLRALVSPSFTE